MELKWPIARTLLGNWNLLLRSRHSSKPLALRGCWRTKRRASPESICESKRRISLLSWVSIPEVNEPIGLKPVMGPALDSAWVRYSETPGDKTSMYALNWNENSSQSASPVNMLGVLIAGLLKSVNLEGSGAEPPKPEDILKETCVNHRLRYQVELRWMEYSGVKSGSTVYPMKYAAAVNVEC